LPDIFAAGYCSSKGVGFIQKRASGPQAIG
jgi:hypothetical protein